MKDEPSYTAKFFIIIGRKLKKTARSIGRFFANIPYRKFGKNTLVALGNFLHGLLFRVLLPKRFRGISRPQIYSIIFKSDTPSGKKFDIWLLVLIILNLVLLILDSFPGLHEKCGLLFTILEWCFTIFFTFEYYLRIYCLNHPWRYVFSFYGIIDFLSIFPAYLSLLFPATHTLSVLRILRTLRVFRIFKLDRFVREGSRLLKALRRSMMKIVVFMLFVYLAAVILGAIVYSIEGPYNEQLNSIPQGIYWAVVTLTTVGYGDVTPITPAGRFISIVIMILGYSIIAIPTGIVAGETIKSGSSGNNGNDEDDDDIDISEVTDFDQDEGLAEVFKEEAPKAEPVAPAVQYCPHCGFEESDMDAAYCRHCGTRLVSKNPDRSWLNDFFKQ